MTGVPLTTRRGQCPSPSLGLGLRWGVLGGPLACLPSSIFILLTLNAVQFSSWRAWGLQPYMEGHFGHASGPEVSKFF